MIIAVAALLLAVAHPIKAQTALTLWHPWKAEDMAVLMTWIDAYRESSGVIIETQYVPFFEITRRYANPPDGRRPDMVIGPSDWTGQLTNNRLLTQLGPLLSQDYRAQAADLAWRLASYDGVIVAIPVTLEGLGLYYNKSQISDPPATFEALLDSRTAIFPLDFYPTAGIFFAFGGQFMDNAGNPLIGNGDALVRYLAVVRDLWARAGRGELLIDPRAERFESETALYVVAGNWELPAFKAALGDKAGFAPLPPVQGKAWQPFVRAQLIYITLGGQRVDAALNFARFVTDTAAQNIAAKAGLIPVNPAASDPAIASVTSALLADGQPIPNRPELAVYWRVMNEAIASMKADGADPGEVARQTVAKLTQEIELFRNPPTPTPVTP